MTPTPTAQLALPLSGDEKARPSVKPRKVKPHHRPRNDGPLLPLAQPRYLPVVGVPKTRAECPDTSKGFCSWVRCRYHLFLEDAEHRAGRPGLANVPRDARGLVVRTMGHAGDERAGTGLAARWLELERSAKVQVVRNDDGDIVEVEPYNMHSGHDRSSWFRRIAVPAGHPGRWIGTVDIMFQYLRAGEPIEVYNDDNELVCMAEMTVGGALKFHGKPRGIVLTLVRVRGVESCALDVIAKKGRLSNQETGECLARHRTLIAREAKGAARKAARIAAEMGMSADDLRTALIQMGVPA